MWYIKKQFLKEALIVESHRSFPFLSCFQLFNVILNTFNWTQLVQLNSLPWEYISSGVFFGTAAIKQNIYIFSALQLADMVFWALAIKWKFGSYLSQGHSDAYFFPIYISANPPFPGESRKSRLANINFLSYITPSSILCIFNFQWGKKRQRVKRQMLMKFIFLKPWSLCLLYSYYTSLCLILGKNMWILTHVESNRSMTAKR